MGGIWPSRACWGGCEVGAGFGKQSQTGQAGNAAGAARKEQPSGIWGREGRGAVPHAPHAGLGLARGTACAHARLLPQVPQDEWSGYPAVGKDGEIPCRRMRSGSYIKAMGDEDSADSDASAKIPPRAATRQDSYRRSSSADQARSK